MESTFTVSDHTEESVGPFASGCKCAVSDAGEAEAAGGEDFQHKWSVCFLKQLRVKCSTCKTNPAHLYNCL